MASARRLRRWIGGVALSLVSIAILAAASGWIIARRSLPAIDGEHPVANLDERITIRFDAQQRPYVRAASFGDALYAEGYLHATHRLWQMELFRRTGRGRLAQALGASLLDTDRELWRAGVPRLAERIEVNATPELRALVERYVAGVNAGVASLKVRPPELLLAQIELSDWTPADVYAVGAVMAFDSANNSRNELLRLALSQTLDAPSYAAFLPDETRQPHFPYVIEPAQVISALARADALDAYERAGLPSAAMGSNGWAVAPARSASQRALFAFDSHDTLALPNLFYEVHLFFGDKQVRGWSVAGLPGVINGFNRRIAWGFTNIGDTQDLFVETRDERDPLRFRSGDDWYEARLDRVTIPVKGRAAPEMLDVVVTRNGRLISDEPAIALRWTGQDEDARGLDALLAMNLAESWPEFRAAIDQLFAPSANITYADADGRIAFRTVGRLPLRGNGAGLAPLRGDDPANAWRGVVPVADLPSLLDPPQGFVAAANARVTDAAHPVLVSADNATGYRIARIRDVLSASAQHDIDSMRTLQTDWRNGQAARLGPVMLRSLDATQLSPVENAARTKLAQWLESPDNEPDLAGPLLFERWYLTLAQDLFAARLGPELYGRLLKRNYMLAHALDDLIATDHASIWWKGERYRRLQTSFRRAVETLRPDLGDDVQAWRWSDRHQVTFAHELGGAAPLLDRLLNRGPYVWGGGTSTVGRGNARYDRPARVDMAATVRVVAEMGEPVRAFAVIPGGQSGHFASAHYDDQLSSYLRGELYPLAPFPEDIAGDVLVLAPLR